MSRPYNPPAIRPSGGQRRRTSSASRPRPDDLNPSSLTSNQQSSATTSGLPEGQGFPQPLRPIPGTPASPDMSVHHSPRPGSGFSSPGLNFPQQPSPRGTPSPGQNRRRSHFEDNPLGVTWESAQPSPAQVNGYTPQPKPERGFFNRNFRSFALPSFYRSKDEKDYYHKEKLGRGRIPRSGFERMQNFIAVLCRRAWRMRKRLTIIFVFLFLYTLFYATPLHRMYRRTRWLGGGSKYVIILAVNQGGGVMEWKGPAEWAIEKDSIKNKRAYARRHGYDLHLADMGIKKRYAHEWREEWEKVDTFRSCLDKYPQAEWFWWLDVNTFVMEPSISLQSQVFNKLAKNTYRDINHYNPLNITHPPAAPHLDKESRSPVGDGLASSINMILPQDCSGFNLGSFFMRRSPWMDHLLDLWWDPVMYEQKHMQWEHKEQDAFEHLYVSQPWVRSHTAFISQRKIGSFPNGACGENDANFHYNVHDRDFMVNMAGCEWGRDCWGEMSGYRELSNHLNRNPWEKFKDGVGSLSKGVASIFERKESKENSAQQ